MTESKLETVSSLVDDYQPTDEQLLEASKDQQMSDTWSRYHLIGDVLRDDAPEQLDIDLSVNIASAIAAEPTVLAPKRKTVAEKVKDNVVKLVKPFGQVAIAASAATLMIMGVQQNVAQHEHVEPTQMLQTTPFMGTAEPVSLNIATPEKLSKAQQKQDYLEQQRRFQALLKDHQQQLKLKGIQSQDTNQASEDENTHQ